MDNEFLAYYEKELSYLGSVAQPFAEQHPQVAGRLNEDSFDIADPYTERFLESFAFLTARIHLKMDAEFPQFTQNILDVLCPGISAPTPSMGVVAFDRANTASTPLRAHKLSRGSIMQRRVHKTLCQFATASDIQIQPLSVESAFFSNTPDLKQLEAFHKNFENKTARSVLNLQLSVNENGQLAELSDLDSLQFYLNGEDVYMYKLLEMMLGHCAGIELRATDQETGEISTYLGADCIKHDGFELDEAMLPEDPRVPHGARILQEYFACPAKFMFFSLHGLEAAVSRLGEGAQAHKFEIIFYFDRISHELEGNVSRNNLRLNCVPVINLFERQLDQIKMDTRLHEYHLVADRTHPMDHEVYKVLSVKGLRSPQKGDQTFSAVFDTLNEHHIDEGAYYAVRREPRKISDIAERDGARSGYLGSEVFLSLVDKTHAAFSRDITGLDVKALCSNRDLPLDMSEGQELTLRAAPEELEGSFSFIKSPTRPRAAIERRDTVSRLVSLLSANYLGLLLEDPQRGIDSLKELLSLYAQKGDPVLSRQVQSIKDVQIKRFEQRLRIPGSVVYGRGVKITLEVDEYEFAGISPYLFAAVLYQFLSRYAGINMMLRLELTSALSGSIGVWTSKPDGRPTI